MNEEIFCNYCPCQDCKTGESLAEILHAQTERGDWICDVCYEYEVCQDFPERKGKGPCLDEARKTCAHRPKLVTGWIKK